MLGLFVYIFLFSLTILFSRQYALAEESNDTKKQMWAFAMIMLVFSLIVGLRWEVGIDYSAYYDLLVGDVSYWAYDRLEPISRWSILFVQKSQLPFYTWFIFVAFTQIFFLVKSFRGKYAYLLPLGIFCFLAYTLSFNMNVARQGCALSIALYAYSFIRSEEHTSELQSRQYLVCRLLLETKKSLPPCFAAQLPRGSATSSPPSPPSGLGWWAGAWCSDGTASDAPPVLRTSRD